MVRSILKLTLLACLVLVGTVVQAQMIPPRTYQSLEWDVADSNLVAHGHITAKSFQPDAKAPKTRTMTVSIAVDETLKGPAVKELRFHGVEQTDPHFDWQNRTVPLLIFARDARRSAPSRRPWGGHDRLIPYPDTGPVYTLGSVLELGEKATSTYVDGREITDPKSILAAARRIAKTQSGKQYVVDRVKLSTSGYLNKPKEISAMPHWGLDPPSRLDPNSAYDGERILAGVGTTAYLWEAHSGKTLLSLPCSDNVTSVAFSPDGRHAMIGAQDGSLTLWNLESGKPERFLGPLRTAVTKIEFATWSQLAGESAISVEEPLVITTSERTGWQGYGANNLIQTVWDWKTGEAVFVVPGSEATFSPDRSTILSWQDPFMYSQSWLGAWDNPSNLQMFLLKSPNGAGGWFRGGQFTPYGDRLLTCEFDGVKRRDPETGAALSALTAAQFDRISLSANGDRIVATDSHSLTVLEAKTGKPVALFPYPANFPYLKLRAILNSTGRACLASWWVVSMDEQSSSLWDVDSGQELLKLDVQPTGFSPDGEAFCAVDRVRKRVTIWSAETGLVIRTFPIAQGRAN